MVMFLYVECNMFSIYKLYSDYQITCKSKQNQDNSVPDAHSGFSGMYLNE